MIRRTHHIQIDRIVIKGAAVGPLDATEISQLVERAVARELMTAALPTGPTMRRSARIEQPSITRGAGAPAIAAAVATGVASAIRRGAGRG